MNPPAASLPDLAGPFDLRNDLRPGDLGAIISLHGTVFAQECGFDSTFEAHIAHLLGEFVKARSERDQLWIAEQEGRLVGSIAVVSLSGKDAQLSWFLVDPSVRSLGLGRRLLDEAIAFCRRWEYEYVFLRNFRVLATASRLFRSVGLAKAGERPSERWGAAVVEELYVLHPLGRRVKEQADEPVRLP
ncbi:MAG TPA: GNAT family N-acetyltransferase [Gemmataceae bacterium]|jgi:GNAT superfamily N-acetyltransferase